MDDDERNNFVNLDERLEPQTEEKGTCVRLRGSKVDLHGAEEKVDQLKSLISKNIPGYDLIICVFVAALKSYKVDQCLRPFPQCFLNHNNEKDFHSLKKACDNIPPLAEFLRLPPNNISKDVRDLLKWLFIDSGIPVLNLYPREQLPLSVINEKASINALPQYVFEVNYNPKVEETWKRRISSKEIFYAFHGSSINNFYSILKFGLQQHFGKQKEVIFGNGIYLSNEISVCTNYAPFSETWQNSILGSKQSLIAVCEVINDEEDVKCKDEKNRKRAMNKNSFGEIPEKYFVVTNSELVKVKYLLVYRNKAASVVGSFIKKNSLWIVILLYLFMLIFIGFLNGPLWQKFVRYLYSLLE